VFITLTTNAEDLTSVDDSGMPDPFNQRPNVERDKKPGEWDSNTHKDVEDYEAESWKHNPDEFIDGEDFDAVEETNEPETEEPDQPDQDPSEETEEESPEPSEPVEDIATPTRAQQRIQELNAQRKRAETENSELRAMMREMVTAQKFQADIARQQIDARNAHEAQLAQARQREELLNNFKQLGFDESKISDWLAFEAIQKAEAAEERARRAEQDHVQRVANANYRAYEIALAGALDRSIKDLGLTKEQRDGFYEQAYLVARDKQLKDPNEAVRRVLAPVQTILQRHAKAAKPKPTLPKPDAQTQAVISAKGRAVNRAPGEKASGKKELAADVRAFLR
jgi:hypothetical protein